MDTWKMIHFNELFFCEFVLPIGPYQGNDWKQQPNDKKVVRRIFFNYGTMIGVFAFSLLLHSFVQNNFTIFHTCYVFWLHGSWNEFSFQLSFCFSKYMRFVLELDNYLKSLSQSFLWCGNFTSTKPPFSQLYFQFLVDYKT
jgi:hypothetical protein